MVETIKKQLVHNPEGVNKKMSIVILESVSGGTDSQGQTALDVLKAQAQQATQNGAIAQADLAVLNKNLS